MQLKAPIAMILILLLATTGCDDSLQIAREAANRQAQQNTVMGKIVDADANAHQQIIGVHHDLQAERVQLNNGWNKLEDERREIAGERRTESMLVSVTKLGGGGLLVLLLLGFCWLVILAARHDHPQAELHELVLDEVLSEKPPLIAELPRNQVAHMPAELS
jgi:hypothetical protein